MEYLRDMKEREAEEKEQKISYIRKLFMKWRCEHKSCSYYDHLCLSAGKRHCRLNSNAILSWNVEIFSNKALIDIPPLDLHSMFAKDVQNEAILAIITLTSRTSEIRL